MIHTKICTHSISVDDGIAFVTHKGSGAICTFIGIVRNNNNGKEVTSLEYECYLPMAERMLYKIAQDAQQKFDIKKIYIAHRHGHLEISDISVFICISSAHRDDAFRACRFIIEWIKEEIPMWKKEYYKDLTSQWVICKHHTIHEHNIQALL